MKTGQIELKVVNGDETGWENLSLVWDYLHEEDKFFDYIQKEIQVFMEDKGGSHITFMPGPPVHL